MPTQPKIEFVVYSHPNLDFQGSRERVHEFIAQRLQSFGHLSVQFHPSRDGALKGLAMMPSGACDFLVLMDAMNPILDMDLMDGMVSRLSEERGAWALRVVGAVPGTQPELVVRGSSLERLQAASMNEDSIGVFRWGTQERFNNQFNLYKHKRLKMFLGLLGFLPDFASLSIKGFIQRLEHPETYTKLVTYFTEGELHHYEACPHCRGALDPLRSTTSQPMIGYLPNSKAAYFECLGCGLIVQSPILKGDALAGIYDAFDTQDFRKSHTNPFAFGGNKARMDFSRIERALPAAASTLDLGGGLGFFSRALKERFPRWEVTHAEFEHREDSELHAFGVKTQKLNFLKEDIQRATYDLITAWEVIEHIPYESLGAFLGNVQSGLKKGGFFVFSTPDYDSPTCRVYDFFSACVPFHPIVFRERWLNQYLRDLPGWGIFDVRYTSDLLDDADMWFSYCEKTAPTTETRSMATLLKEVFNSPQGAEVKKHLLSKGMGTEVIVTLQRL